jgi:hypothetical protein
MLLLLCGFEPGSESGAGVEEADGAVMSAAGAGLPNTGSAPEELFGNAMTSRIDGALQRIAIMRSKPGM